MCLFFLPLLHVYFGDAGWVNFTVLMLPATLKMAKWSDINVCNILCICPDGVPILLRMMWSLHVAKDEVTLVDLVIWEYTLPVASSMYRHVRHKFPLDARIRIASHAGKCAHVREFASHARNARICAHSHPMRENARLCAHSHPMRKNAHICVHLHRMRGNARITTRKTRKWDCGNDASPSVLAPDPWNWVCSR